MSSAVRMGVNRTVAAVARPVQARRAMSNGAARIEESRKVFQSKPHLHGADNPTYLKQGTSDGLVTAIGGLLVGTGFFKFANGLYHMSFGTNVLEIE